MYQHSDGGGRSDIGGRGRGPGRGRGGRSCGGGGCSGRGSRTNISKIKVTKLSRPIRTQKDQQQAHQAAVLNMVAHIGRVIVQNSPKTRRPNSSSRRREGVGEMKKIKMMTTKIVASVASYTTIKMFVIFWSYSSYDHYMTSVNWS